jgi:hypothetical protein
MDLSMPASLSAAWRSGSDTSALCHIRADFLLQRWSSGVTSNSALDSTNMALVRLAWSGSIGHNYDCGANAQMLIIGIAWTFGSYPA